MSRSSTARPLPIDLCLYGGETLPETAKLDVAPLHQILNELRAKRGPEKTPTQMAQSTTAKMSSKQKVFEKHRATL